LLPIAGFPVLPTPCDIYNALSPHASKSHDLPRSSANAAGAQREKCHPKRTSKQSHDSQTTIIVNEQITTEPLLLTTTRVQTFFGTQLLTGAGSFFFEREGRLFLVTSRHVLIDPPTNHHPDRIEIELHTHSTNLTFRPVGQCCCIARQENLASWQGLRRRDRYAVIELERSTLPLSVVLQCFTHATSNARCTTWKSAPHYWL
jgi:hypothetical protein